MIGRMLTTMVFGGMVLVGSMAQAGDWPQWRGPNFNGSAAADEKQPPITFSKTENVAWVRPMPGPSAATPVVMGDRVFVSSFVPDTVSVDAICVDRRTGEILWQRRLGPGRDSRSPNTENYLAEPSAVTDGRKVIFQTGNGDLVAFTMEGEEIWRRNLQDEYGSFAIMWGYASSPLLYKDKLYVPVLQRDRIYGNDPQPRESFLLCIDPNTGKNIFRVLRPDDARDESKESYGTPIPREVDGRTEIVLLGGDCITGHDAETGKELWRYGGWNPRKINHWRIVPSPTVGGGLVYASAPKGQPVFAVKIDENNQTSTAWKFTEAPTDVATPLFYDGDLFVLNGEGRDKYLSRIDPATGQTKWSAKIDSSIYIRSSPTAADDTIYFINAEGVAFVYSAKDGSQLHKVELGGYPTRASISIAGGQLFIRTAEALYCIGK